MINGKSKRFAGLRLLREKLGTDERGSTHLQMQRIMLTMDRLSRFRACLLEQDYAGISLPDVAIRRGGERGRDRLTL